MPSNFKYIVFLMGISRHYLNKTNNLNDNWTALRIPTGRRLISGCSQGWPTGWTRLLWMTSATVVARVGFELGMTALKSSALKHSAILPLYCRTCCYCFLDMLFSSIQLHLICDSSWVHLINLSWSLQQEYKFDLFRSVIFCFSGLGAIRVKTVSFARYNI